MSTKRIAFTEDWVVVILGLGLVLLAILGCIIPKPSFSWESTSDLTTKVFSISNLTKIASQFITVLITAILGALLLNKSIKSLLIVFPSVFVLTIFALILAGNSTVKEYNLEAVIFALGIEIGRASCREIGYR